jgi:mannose-6-phosphate isomerase-like protein (cupin superfamily)
VSAGEDRAGLPKPYKVSLVGTRLIEEPDNCAVVRPIVQAEEAGSSMSLTWVSINGRHRELASRRSARTYYVLSGSLAFSLTGATEALGPGDVLVIPRGCRYYLEGTGTYLVINTPAFREGDDEY